MGTSSAAEFPKYGILPKREIGAIKYLEQHPDSDGRGVVVAVFDTGVDPGAVGLEKTSDGKPKIIDVVDGSGSGDVNTSTNKKSEDGKLEGLTGRTLTVPKNWKNPSGDFHLGMKPGYELYPDRVLPRLKSEQKKKWTKHSRAKIAELTRDIQSFDKKHPKPNEDQKKQKTELDKRLAQFKKASASWKDPGPVFDCVVFNDGNHWRAAIDTDEDGDFEDEKLLTNFRTEREYGTFNEENLINYVLNIYEDGNLLSIVVDCGTHASHVAGIISANYPDHPEMNGVAPGAQIVSVKIGDTRIGSSSLGPGQVRGLITVLENKCDLINMSYGGASSSPNLGRLVDLYSEIVDKHGVLFVCSAGNDGPALSTVGSPGGTSTALLGVGAYISPELMEVGYSLREKLTEQPYTWSSRGPTFDGDLGVDICAPGGAIAPVSRWALSRNQMMNGTSMSSPNACGGIALLMSGLKAAKIDYSPEIVKRAVKNSTRPLKDSDPFSTGQGLLQVDAAYDWLEKHATVHGKRLRFEVTLPSLNDARGIYLREPNEKTQALDTLVEISPTFHEDTPNRVKADFEMRFRLECKDKWVEYPEHFFLHHGGRSFRVKVDSSSLKPGMHYSEVVGYDVAHPELGPLFRVPITVIAADDLKENEWKQTIKFSPGDVHRRFLNIPPSATWADLKINTQLFDSDRLLVIHTLQVAEDRTHKSFGKRTYLRIRPETEKVISFPVVGGRTLEVCVAQYWNSLGDADVEFELTLHGIQASPDQLVLDGSRRTGRINLTGTLGKESIDPSASFDTLRRVIRPTKSEMLVLPSDRDLLPDNRQAYGLTLTYPFTLSAKTTVSPLLAIAEDDQVIDALASTLWMIYDKNKQLVGTGVSGKDATLVSGDYTLRMFLRHDNPAKLKTMEGAVLWLDQKLKFKIMLTARETNQVGLINSGSFESHVIEAGQTIPVYLSVPSQSSMPKDGIPGDRLTGKIYYGDEVDNLDGEGQRPGGYPLTLLLVEPPKPKPAATDAQPKAKKSLDDLLFDTKLAHLQSLAKQKKSEDFEKLAAELLKIKPKHLPILKARITMLDGDNRKEHLPAVVKACDKVINAAKTKPLAAYFGIRRDPKTDEEKETHKIMTERRDALIDALYHKARAIAYMDLPVDPSDKDKPAVAKSPKTEEQRDALFEKTYKQLSGWVDPTEKKYALVHIRRLRRHDHQAEALEELSKIISEEPTNLLLYKKRADMYGELGWENLQQNENQWKLLRKRSNYLPF